MPPAKPPVKKRTGPVPKPVGELARHCSTSLRAVVLAYLKEIGSGSQSRGLRIVAEHAYAQGYRPTQNP